MADINPNRYYTIKACAYVLGNTPAYVLAVLKHNEVPILPLNNRTYRVLGSDLVATQARWESYKTRYCKLRNKRMPAGRHDAASASIARAASEVDHA
jgi:hypothetical protein